LTKDIIGYDAQSQEVFKKYTGIFAISIDGVVGWDLYEKSGINAEI